VGLGYIGRTHLAAAAKVPGARVIAVCDQDASIRRQTYPELHVYSEACDLFADSDVDAVILCVPTWLHERYAIAAAEAGKHILCEKPFALDAAQATRMLEASFKSDVKLMIAQVLRFWPHYVRLVELVREGRIGSVKSISAWRLAAYPSWSSWFRNPEQSGGCLLDLQIHDLDLVYSMLGRPEAISASAVRSTTGNPDHVFTTLRYRDRIAHLEASYLMPKGWPFQTGIRVNGSEGCLAYSFSVEGNIQERAEAGHRFTLHQPERDRNEIEVEPADPFVEQLRYFTGQLEPGMKMNRCLPEDSLAVMRIADSCRQAVSTEGIVYMDDVHATDLMDR
jgi:predicted dehydrogenase